MAPRRSGKYGVPTRCAIRQRLPPRRRPRARPGCSVVTRFSHSTWPRRASKGGRGADAHGRLGRHHHALDLGEGVRRERAPRHGPVEGHEARLGVERHVERGDVAVAEQGLRIAAHGRKVEKRQESRGAVAAARAPDRVDAVVREHAVEIGGAGGIGAREVSVAIEEVGARPHAEPQRLERLDGEADVLGLVRRGGRGDEADGLSGRQPARAEQRHARHLTAAGAVSAVASALTY